jgi:pimeloyl-ACP methyl ester carboxylesterase
MPVDQLWCEPAGLQLFIATVKESATPGRPTILYCPGIADTGIGGSGDRALQQAVERLSFYCHTEVVGANPHGLGESDGTLEPTTLLSDLKAIITFLAPRPLVLIGFGLIGYAMLACGGIDPVVGVVTVDPLVDQTNAEEIANTGVRLSPTSRFPAPKYALPTTTRFARWILITPGDRPREDSLDIEGLVQQYRPEIHRVYATSSRLHNDPRPYALILGWLERELWPTSAAS